MSKIEAFDENSIKYDNWFTNNPLTYESELNAIKSLIPKGMQGIEIGVGTGRFAVPLGITIGVEPSPSMAELARSRGIHVLEGIAEQLPVEANTFDYALMVTAICFFDDVKAAFQEAYRIITDDGFLVIAFIDKESELGKQYEKRKQTNQFYKDATFYSVDEITVFLREAGFSSFEYMQTVYNTDDMLHEIKQGYGDGGFVVVKAVK